MKNSLGNIYTFKAHFEELVQPAPQTAPVCAHQAWDIFRNSLLELPEDEACEELGFSMSLASHFDGHQVVVNENQFQIYFGRLVDAVKGSPWHTAEINFYYRYAMNPRLLALLAQFDLQDCETAFCKADDPERIQQKIERVCAFAAERQELWKAVQDLQPELASYHFWIQ
jgi:hypothetical protein